MATWWGVLSFLCLLPAAALCVTTLLLCLKDGGRGLPQLCHVMRKSRCDHGTYQVKCEKRRNALDTVCISGAALSDESNSAQMCKEVLGEDCWAYVDHHGKAQPAKSCSIFCCGNCTHRYCCSNMFLKFGEERQLHCNLLNGRSSDSGVNYMQAFSDPDDYLSSGPSFGTLVSIGIAVFAVIVITIILCLTCSCCCLYKACRRPRPVVTATTSTTVVHAPYPQQGVPPSYPVAPYQGYQPVAIQPQPGMPVAPYPAQYPPPYPMQPSGPPAYHETVAAGAGPTPPVSQPPYNPAYVDPQRPTY